jgi:hypothetical protein
MGIHSVTLLYDISRPRRCLATLATSVGTVMSYRYQGAIRETHSLVSGKFFK